jgi:hypothetical protein
MPLAHAQHAVRRDALTHGESAHHLVRLSGWCGGDVAQERSPKGKAVVVASLSFSIETGSHSQRARPFAVNADGRFAASRL